MQSLPVPGKVSKVLLPVFMVLALLLALAGSQVIARPVSAATLNPLSLVYYGQHDAYTDQRIVNARPQMLISNTPAGYWHGNANSAFFQAQGIRVYSYIYANYDQFPLSQNQALIDAIAREGTYGIFVDMVSPSATSYNAALYNYAKSRGLSVIINPGMPYVDASIYNVADYVMTDEHYSGRAPTAVEAANLKKTIVIGFGATTAQQAATYTNAAWANSFPYSWHEHVEYMSLPSYLEEYVNLLRPPTTYPAPAPTPTPTPNPITAPAPAPAPITGNTTGTVASTPVPTGAANEYNLYLRVTSSTVSGISAGQLVWLAATTTDFPTLRTPGSTVSGNLDRSPGWWVLKKSTTTTPAPAPAPTPILGNTTGTVASTPIQTGAANEYSLYLRVTVSTVSGISAGQLVWLAATTTDYSTLRTLGSTVTGNMDRSLGWWVLKK